MNDRKQTRPPAHPDPDELAAYHAGALAPADEMRVQDHLVDCPECAPALLDIARFAAPEDFDSNDAAVPDGLEEAVWAGVRDRIRAEQAERDRRDRFQALARPSGFR